MMLETSLLWINTSPDFIALRRLQEEICLVLFIDHGLIGSDMFSFSILEHHFLSIHKKTSSLHPTDYDYDPKSIS